jgi:nucleotide-binding universal stress UspA family protein
MTPDIEHQTEPKSKDAVVGTHRIVAGIDGSGASLGALRWAADQAERTQATLEVVMAWHWPFAYDITPLLHESDPVSESRKVFESAMAEIRREYPCLDLAGRLEHGHPAKILIDASRGADLLVVGSRGHGEFSGMVLGSVSQHCAHKAACPVLIHREVE